MINETDVYDATSLLDNDIPELKHWVDDLVVPGLTLFAAAPKVGKSYLMLYLSYCIAIGQKAFDKRPVKKGKVLYMALEDNKRRLQKRLKEIMERNLMASFQKPDDLHLFSEGDLAETGRFKALEQLINKRSYDVVIIDILQRIAKPNETGTYKKDYHLLRKLKGVADSTDTAIIAVHHTNKKKSKNSLNNVSGTQGLTGACDNVIVMNRGGLNDHTLYIEAQGRDLEAHETWLTYGTDDASIASKMILPPRNQSKLRWMKHGSYLWRGI